MERSLYVYVCDGRYVCTLAEMTAVGSVYYEEKNRRQDIGHTSPHMWTVMVIKFPNAEI